MKAYLFASLILLFIWLVIYIFKRDLRREMLWSSIILTPVALTEIFFVPSYWSPITLLEAIKPWDLESFIFSFAVGGIAAVSYELVNNKRLIKNKKSKTDKYKFKIYSVLVLSFILTGLFNINVIYDFIIAMAATSFAVFIKKPEFRSEIVIGGFIFLLIYFFTLQLSFLFDPNFLSQWNIENLSGIIILGLPLEEYLFGFLFGALWSPIYEIVKGYKHI